ncbi:MAG: hypothetical protein ACREHG_06895 [Candidatus Saccharimonadales bacterium]
MRGITENEEAWLGHMMMFGSTGYPVAKVNSRWIWQEAFGVQGSPTTYRTKKACVEAITKFQDVLIEAYGEMAQQRYYSEMANNSIKTN